MSKKKAKSPDRRPPEPDRPVEVEPDWFKLQHEFPAEVKQRAFDRAQSCCQSCGARGGRGIYKRLMTWPDPKAPWQYLDDPKPEPWDASIVIVELFVAAPTHPWSGDETVLEVLCFACLVHRLTARRSEST
jgi:hypothetical protein